MLIAPGLDEQATKVTIHDDPLAIEGALVIQAPEGTKPVWEEFGPSKFRRSLRLGAAVEASRREALDRNGLLMITLPKAEGAGPRQIPVQLTSRDTEEAGPAPKEPSEATRSEASLRLVCR